MRGTEKFIGLLEAKKAIAPVDGKAGAVEYDHELFEILRTKRKELADAAHVPPYVIFSDKTLIEMAIYYPTSTKSMKKIFGVGSLKLEKYGQLFSDLIAVYCMENHLIEKRKPGARRAEETQSLEQIPKHIQVGEAFNSGASIPELMDRFGVQQATILNHLSKYILEGHVLRSDEFLALPDLPEGLRQGAMGAFESLGTEYLKPVFEELNGAVSYDDLKILRLYYLTNRNNNPENDDNEE